MRPSPLFLWLCLGALCVTVITVALPSVPPEWGLVPFGVLIILFAMDWLLSSGRRALSVTLSGPTELYTGEETAFTLDALPMGGSFPYLPNLKGHIDWPEGLSGPDSLEA